MCCCNIPSPAVDSFATGRGVPCCGRATRCCCASPTTTATGWSGGIVGEFFWLCLNGRETLRIWRDVLALHGPVVRLAPAALDRVAGYASSVMQGEASSPARASAIAYACAMAVADELLPWGEALGQGTAASRIGPRRLPHPCEALGAAGGGRPRRGGRLQQASFLTAVCGQRGRAARALSGPAAVGGGGGGAAPQLAADQDDRARPRLQGPELFREGLRRHIRTTPAALSGRPVLAQPAGCHALPTPHDGA